LQSTVKSKSLIVGISDKTENRRNRIEKKGNRENVQRETRSASVVCRECEWQQRRESDSKEWQEDLNRINEHRSSRAEYFIWELRILI